MNKGNYYLEEKIGNSGVAKTINPIYASNKYEPFKISPTKTNVGEYFNNDSSMDISLGDINESIQNGLSIDDTRAQQQSALDMWGNALVNNLVIAGTTAISGTLGTLNGLLEAASTGEINRIWDNSVNNWAVEQQEAARAAFPIYRGKEYEEKSIGEKLGTGIFWAEAFQNLGFTEGMIIPGMGVSALLTKAPKMARMILPSFVSSIGEGSIEAINTKNDEVRNKTALANQKYQDLVRNAESPLQVGILSSEYEDTLEAIEEDAKAAGNFVLGSNIALLTATNTIQFGKLFSRGFNTSKRMANTQIRLGSGLTRTAEGLYEGTSKGMEIAKAVGKKVLDATSESFEEFSQETISRAPSLSEDYNQFNESVFNPEYRNLATNIWQGLLESTAISMNDPRTHEAAAMGFFTGLFGVPMLRKSKVPITLENSIFGEISEAKNRAERNQKIVDTINQRISEDKKIDAYYNGLVRNLAMQERMNTALDNNNIFEFKNAESAQFISDIMMFDNAGDIDRLRDIINNSIDTSDEGIKAIIEETSKDENGPFMQNGNAMSIEEVRTTLEEKRNLLNSKIDEYLKDKEALSSFTPSLSNSAMENALFLKGQIRDYKERFRQISDRAYSGVRDLFKEASKAKKEEVKTKINKGEGIYVTIDGKKKLVRKDSIDYFDEAGNPIFKNTDNSRTNPMVSEQDFISEWLTNKEFNATVNSLLNDSSSPISFDERKEIARNLRDMFKLTHAIGTYSKNLSSILSNPSLADSIIESNAKEAEKEYKERAINDILSDLSKAKTPSELGNIINNLDNQDYLEDAFKAIEESDNDDLKKIVKTYTELNDLRDSIEDILKEFEDNPDKISANNIINDALDNADNEEDVKGIIRLSLNMVPKPVKDILENTLSLLEEHKESKKAVKKDENKAKKEVKKKKKFSLKDASDNEDDVAYVEEGESKGINKNIAKIENASKDELEAIASGKKKVQGIEPKEEVKVRKLAKTVLEFKKLPKKQDNGEGTNSEDNKPERKRKEPYLKSWYHTKYSFKELNGDKRKAVIYESPVVEALDDLGAFDFVDNGELGLLFNNNRDIPIHYVVSKDPKLKDVIVLAIEVTKKIEGLVDTSKSFVAQDNKRYQAVGSLGADSEIGESVGSYKAIVNTVTQEYNKSNNKDSEFFVSSKTNKIKHIYSGRMVKSSNSAKIEQRPLKDIVNTEEPIHLGIFYNRELHTPSLDLESYEVVPLNTNNANTREGSVWLMNREADGRYYAKSIKVKRFTEEEYDLEEHLDTPIVQEIRTHVRTLINSEASDYDRAIAKFALKSILYFPENYDILFKDDIVSITNFENNIGKDLSLDEKETAFLEALQNPELNLRFQVATSRVSNEDYITDLLDSDILTTDLLYPNNVNASFDLYTVDEKTIDIIENKEYSPVGHTGRKGVNNSIAFDKVTLNGSQYSIDKENNVYYNNNLITNQRTVDEVLLLNQIVKGEVEPIEGSPDLYVGYHSSDGSEFGILNGRTIKGNRLSDLINTAKKKVDKTNKEKNAKDFLEGFDSVSDEELYKAYEEAEESKDTYEEKSKPDSFKLSTSNGNYSMLKDLEALRKTNREEFDIIQPAYEYFYKAKENGIIYSLDIDKLKKIVKGTSLENKLNSWFTEIENEEKVIREGIKGVADGLKESLKANSKKIILEYVNKPGVQKALVEAAKELGIEKYSNRTLSKVIDYLIDNTEDERTKSLVSRILDYKESKKIANDVLKKGIEDYNNEDLNSNDDLFVSASTEELMAAFNLNEEVGEPITEDDLKEINNESKAPDLSDTNRGDSSKSINNVTNNTNKGFNDLARSNLMSIIGLGYKKIDDFISTVEKGHDISNIKTQEDFDKLIEDIKNCPF